MDTHGVQITIPLQNNQLPIKTNPTSFIDPTPQLLSTNLCVSPYKLAFVELSIATKPHLGFLPTIALHDSGCASSLMKTSFFKTLTGHDILPLEDKPNTYIVSATGQRTKVFGKATFILKFSGINGVTKEFPLDVHIHDDVEYDFMLGRDFTGSQYKLFETTTELYLTDNNTNNGAIDAWETQKHNICVIPILSENEHQSNSINIYTTDDIIIPPMSLMNVMCEPKGSTFVTIPTQGMVPFEIISITQPDLKTLTSTMFEFQHIHQISIPVFNNSLEDYYVPYQSRLAQIKLLHSESKQDMISINFNRIDTTNLLTSEEKECLQTLHSNVQENIASDEILTEEEKELEFMNFINKGSYSIPMSSYIDQAPTITEMEYKNIPTEPKTDEEFLQQFNLKHLPPMVQQWAKDMFLNHRDVFTEHDYDIGKAKDIEMTIDIDETKPRIQKFIPLPHNVREQVREILDQMIEFDIIRECNEPSLFCSNLLVTKKKDKSQIRILLDGRLLNNATVRLPTNLVTQMEVFSHLSNKKHVSTIDVSQAFYQVPLSKEAQPYTAFYSEAHGKRYCFKRSPQGLKNSPLFLKLLMDKIFGHMARYVIHYVDDILIATNKDMSHHLHVVEKVLDCLKEAGIKIKPAKTTIATEEIEFLGILYKKNKLHIPEARVKAFMEYPKPKTPKQVKSFVCAMSYYRRFLHKFADMAKPLMDLTLVHPKQFKWTDLHQASFEGMIQALVKHTSLTLPDADKPFYVQTDASDFCGAGRVFQKDEEGNELLLACVSRTFTKAERKYGVFRKETLSLLYCLKTMDFYLRFAKKVIILVDARAIIFLRMCKDSAGILLRFSLEISKYEAEIHHVQGVDNEISDILSRNNSNIDTILAENKQKSIISEKDTEKILKRLSIPEGKPFSAEELKFLLEADSIENPTLKKKPPSKSKLGIRHVKTMPTTLGEKKLRLPKEARWRKTGVILPTQHSSVQEQQAPTGNTLSYLDIKHVTKLILAKEIPKKMLIEAQKNDNHFRRLTNQSSSASQFQYIEGVLYKKTHNKLKLALPSIFFDPIITSKHYSVMGLHFSKSRIIRDITDKFYVNLRDFKEKLYELTGSCLVCQFNQNMPIQHPLQRFNRVVAPRVTWACDLIPSLPESSSGHTAIFLAIDMFTGYVQLMPLKSKSSPDLIEAILNGIIRPFGIPKYFRCDSETGMFSSKEFYNFMQPLNIEFLPCSIGAPWSNGAAERAVQTIKIGLRKFIQQEKCPEEWDKFLHFFTAAHNKSVNIFGHAPEALHFGFANPAPTDIFQMWPNTNTPDEYVQNIVPIAIFNRQQAREASILNTQRKITYKNKDKQAKVFKIGQLVIQKQLQLATGPGKAMQPKFTGPYVIISLDEDEASCLMEHIHTQTQVRAHFSNITLLNYHPSHNRSAENMEESLLQFLRSTDIPTRSEAPDDYQPEVDKCVKEVEQTEHLTHDTEMSPTEVTTTPSPTTDDTTEDLLNQQEPYPNSDNELELEQVHTDTDSEEVITPLPEQQQQPSLKQQRRREKREKRETVIPHHYNTRSRKHTREQQDGILSPGKIMEDDELHLLQAAEDNKTSPNPVKTSIRKPVILCPSILKPHQPEPDDILEQFDQINNKPIHPVEVKDNFYPEKFPSSFHVNLTNLQATFEDESTEQGFEPTTDSPDTTKPHCPVDYSGNKVVNTIVISSIKDLTVDDIKTTIELMKKNFNIIFSNFLNVNIKYMSP